MSSPVSYELQDTIGVITVDNPPVNALSHAVRKGLLDAIAQGGGPHFFACDEETPVLLAESMDIDNDVILDGEGELVVVGPSAAALSVEAGRTVELRSVRARHPG